MFTPVARRRNSPRSPVRRDSLVRCEHRWRRFAIACLGAMLGLGCWPEASRGLAQQTSPASGIRPADIAALRWCAHPTSSPDGKRVAFTVYVPRNPFEQEDGPARSHLFVLDPSGNARPWITGTDSVSHVAWSPDGRAIYYLAKRTGDAHTAMYRIPTSGGESQRVAALEEASISGFSIHPDGKRVALLAAEPRGAADKKLRDQGFNQEIYEEDWRYTRVYLADLLPPPELGSIPLDASTAGRSTGASPDSFLPLDGSVSFVQWNHAGDRLLAVVAPTPSVDDSYMAKQVVVVDPETGDTLARVEHRGKLGAVAWGPDDRWIAMIAGRDIHDPADGRLMIVAAEGGTPRELMPDYAAHVESLDWIDAQTIAWTAAEGTLSRVGTVTLDGRRRTILAPDAAVGIAHDIDVAADGSRAALLINTRTFPDEVFRLDLTSGALERATRVNPWLEDRRFARQETIRWIAQDGLELEGILLYPLDYAADRRYPMIMLVHGGPESHESDGWLTSYSRPGQIAAARGFFVFYPNYRGSTGRGVEFSMLGQADAAGKEFSDLIDGIDHLIEQGLVDRDRVGITGGSYGGYASAWGATYYSDRFAASVMFVGISDNISKVGTTDIPEEMFLVHHRKRLWEDWEYFLRTSPIRYVERNRTPTLILHGKQDPRVHPSQSLELHRHLKTLGQAPVRLVLYEGEGHGNRKAAARLDYNLRMLRWMEHFLQEQAGQAPPYPIDYQAELGLNSQPTDGGDAGNPAPEAVVE
ncbi:MAG: S9 family peptidase [Planctomycetota bacterium]|nr:MAG: S9 family peptidase [Planctomycetota bacterium]